MLSDQDIFHRYQIKSNEFKKKADISLIGHSLFDMWGDLPNGTPTLANQSVANLGISGVSTRQYLDVIIKPKLITHLGKHIFLFLGVNDICKEKEYSPAKVMEWLNQILDHLHAISPHSHYYLLEATPVNAISTVTNTQINTLNTYLKANCPENVTYIETQSVFSNSDHELNLALCTDGLHFNQEGYQVLANLLEKYLQQ
ncbi:acylneuraminate cytidylyltransferase [Pasteurella canis]|uniref:SGNH hydrolase-type esterase domain-containing protein n=1 Tax=Pasteurella canis TaxID=753 RepID=A0ABQ4VM75_9PAST|nr:SGNH/GDSL hydrolase family protein [Pasteurella canis]MXN89142.1 acylneuraminate cytidylyltransferase [Pasteurella canis]UAX41600.1 acylneuraminate cytidylyltransferase [Pasteurella canis]UAY77106.1 acylneuraminate cytidylyltransferase [Pasteurella canis]UDW83156.1 acylneuraminate cytidylyltransferase [Pasteurella canis]UEC22682.1 acylneuraminate cytidylyltransferase [Pasteurella canis]